ncbi:MAG: TraR/DksA family transcriptional regulator [Deltaproteobacteria bacterium]|nr:TraR/DksA family transcriptional regulator [Deltaproteobacteria bacterium]
MPNTKIKTKKASPAKKKPTATKTKAPVKKATAPNRKPKTAASKAAPKKAKTAAIKPAKAKTPAAAPVKTGAKVPFKKEITQKLIAAKAKILQEVSQKMRTESDVLKFEIGDIYDIASNERERELSLMFGDRDREKLAEIEDALERIRENTYGECEECGEPVAENRLRALPFTRVCVECQSKQEREQRIKGRFEEESGLGILERPEGEDEEF